MNIVVGAGADELLEWARVCACGAVYVYGCRPQAWFDCILFAHIHRPYRAWGRADISKPLLKKPRQSWFPLQSLPVPHQGLGDSGDSGLHRAGGLCEEGEA